MTPLPGSPGKPGRPMGIRTGTTMPSESGGNGGGGGPRPVPGGAALPKAGRDKPRPEGAETHPTGHAAREYARADRRQRAETLAQTGGPGE